MSKQSNEELRKEWERRIEVFRSSGLTQTNWCKVNDISIHQFKYWFKKINDNQSSQSKETKWISMSVEDESPNNLTDTIQIKIGQATIEVKPNFNPRLLANVVKVLKTEC